MARRLVTVLAAAVLWAGAGSAVLTSSAFGGGVDGNGTLTAAVYNSTPYTWTLVAAKSISSGSCLDRGCLVAPAGTIGPGGGSLYSVYPNLNSQCAFEGGVTFGYDAYFTYQVNVVGGPPEFITVGVSQAFRNGDCGSALPSLQVWDTVAPPPAGYDPASLDSPAPQTANPQLAVQLNTPTPFDPTITAVGNFTADGSTDLGQPFVELLNAACGNATGSCSFDATTPVEYIPGPLGDQRQALSCDLGPPPAAGQPANDDPNYYVVEYEAVHTTTFSAGAGVTLSTGFDLLGLVSGDASISVDAEKEWQETKTFVRSAKVYIPRNSWGFLWAAPTIGKVTGTITATVGAAKYTITNFTTSHAGVSGQGDPLKTPTPAYNTVAKTRPMTSAERVKFCEESPALALRLKARAAAAPPAGLRAGRSIARVAIGETQKAVLARLGWPAEKRFELRPCRGLPGCTAQRGLGGTWNYKKRKLSVVFGPDRRVVALEHRGNQRTVRGVGKDSTLAAVRGAFPTLTCRKLRLRLDCSVRRVSGQRTTRTLFRFTERDKRQWRVKRVLIYVDGREVTT